MIFNDKDQEIEFLKDMKKLSRQIVDEIQDYLAIDSSWENRIHIESCHKETLVKLKNAVKKRVEYLESELKFSRDSCSKIKLENIELLENIIKLKEEIKTLKNENNLQ